MAGDWIKMRVDLLDDPAVILISDLTQVDEYGVVGRLHKLWSWADRHTIDGNAAGVTRFWIDHYVGCERFAEAMLAAGWLDESGGRVKFPHFELHNGETAKKRALTNKRVAEHREMKRIDSANSNADSNADSVTESVTRVEKSREELKTTETIVSGPVDQKPINGHPAESKFPNCPQQRIVALYRETFPTACQPKQWDGVNAQALGARWRETCSRLHYTDETEGFEWFKTFFAAIEQSDFLMGKTQSAGRPPFKLRLAWIVKKTNFEKIAEGFYS